MAKKKSGIKAMKLIAIKNECYAISEASNTNELKRKYSALCKSRDFRKRSTWEYILKRLRDDAEWTNIKLSDIETLTPNTQQAKNTISNLFVFRPERVEWDKAANNDD